MTEKKSIDDDDDGWNYDYDGDDDNIDEIDDENFQKTYKYYDFWVKIDLFKGLLLCEKGPKNSGKARK